jgi:sRNA-binding protein
MSIRKRIIVSAALALLAERWPKAFAVYEGRRRPLKVGIHNDIAAALGCAITPAELTYTLSCYVNNEKYLRACSRAGAARIDLVGALAGHVTPEQASHAQTKLAEMTHARMKERNRT